MGIFFLSNDISNMYTQLKWELLKYEIHKFAIDYRKRKVKERGKQEAYSDLKKFENNLESSKSLRKCENDLELIYDHIVEGVRLRSKCDWHEPGEKSTELLLNLEKQLGNQNKIQKLIVNEKEINNETEIWKQIKLFYETLFQKLSQKCSADDINHFPNTPDIPKLCTDQIILCDIELTENDLYDSMKSMENAQSSGNDFVTKGF